MGKRDAKAPAGVTRPGLSRRADLPNSRPGASAKEALAAKPSLSRQPPVGFNESVPKWSGSAFLFWLGEAKVNLIPLLNGFDGDPPATMVDMLGRPLPKPLLFCANQQHRVATMSDNPVGDTAQKPASDSRTSVSGHRYQVIRRVLGEVHDSAGGLPP
jgi:hypothetical protein